jgi:5,10-methenyltetrahydrofolate synthetase
MPAPLDEPSPSRKTLRDRLIAERERFANSDRATAAAATLARSLHEVLQQIEPELLGVYWPVRSEFNAALALQSDESAPNLRLALPLALPFVRRSPPQMEYRRWDGSTPRTIDECRIASSDGEVVVPDTVLVPCVGFTRDGYRLGYGGGFFDRWLALHPHVTTVGIAWSAQQIDPAEFSPEAHDQPLTLIVTEDGVIG